MKIKALSVAAVIEEFAPGILQESWDNSGFSIGGPGKEVSSALLALDCTPSVIKEAIESGADMIITHHPLIFSPLKRVAGESLIEKMVEDAIKNGIVIYSAHTNADKVLPGVSGLMAQRIGLQDTGILDPQDESTGLGVVGNLTNQLTPAELLTLLKERFGLNIIRHSKPIEEPVKRVALCGGSGGSLVDRAIKAGAQVLITGDISYHKFLCEDGFMVMDIGHFESENEVLTLLKDILSKKLPTFEVRISDNNNNLIYYH